MNSPQTLFDTHLPPLAERVRPQTIEEFCGQGHLVDKGKILHRLIGQSASISMIFWGPPGTGKTTLARMIAKSSDAKIKEMSAVSSGVKDLRDVIAFAKNNRDMGQKTILFIDEIHRFSKSQQDALLHAVEDGTITLMGATTENPSFEVISPLLSRCRVLTLKPLQKDHLKKILEKAFAQDVILSKSSITIKNLEKDLLIQSSGGDARKMLNTLEVAGHLMGGKGQITKEILDEAIQSKTLIYDKQGEYHYDTISAFIKSVRGSDPDAALYWLAVMLEGGEKPEFIARRLIILASEDIGNADPNGLTLATSGFQAVHMIGMPEASLILAQVTTYLASAPKSNASYKAIKAATQAVKESGTPSVPLHLRNAPTDLMKDMDYGKDYQYPHSYPDHFVDANYFPNGETQTFYQPSNQGREEWIQNRLKSLWKDRYSKK
ncbi:MAG TPA: replication-associated recombination protein A [Candidatus Marinimicrobia bacterium]|mgnify:FL=1|nr:replication-associated recombination protein A [Candidatus Neomarinimicrobiota bacterium]